MSTMQQEIDTFEPKGKKILMVSAHPDDADMGIGGTLMKWLDQGSRAAIVIVTNGDKGTDNKKLTSQDLREIRHKEQLAASEFLGLDHTWFFDYSDAHLEVTQELKNKIVKIIREYQPDAVATFDPTLFYSLERGYINHPDHRAIGQATIDAVFPMARDFLTFPEHQANGIEPHKVKDLFLYNPDKAVYYSDITQTIDKKAELIKLHASQFDMDKVLKEMRQRHKQVGSQISLDYAEKFLRMTIS